MSALATNDTAFSAMVENVMRELVAAEHRANESLISTPLLYPSGATVVVQVRNEGRSYFVSDMGLGYQEADLMGAGLIYGRHARLIAENAGVGFDNQAFFVVQVSRDQLAGAVIAVANCSQSAAGLAALKLAERKAGDMADRLYDRLITVFRPELVDRHAEIVGASNIRYRVATLVRAEKSAVPTIFDSVTKHPTSVAFASQQFNDIARLEDAPRRVAVVQRRDEFGDYLGLLSQAASVVDIEATKETFRMLARAA